MNATVQAQLTRLEAALDALVDSITTYNPSPAAATQLLAADADLAADLDTLSTHQRNARTLHDLRTTSAQLDERIKSTLGTLATTRKELQARAAPPPGRDEPAASSGVDYALLLNTAQRIAPFTRPRIRASRPAGAGDAAQAAPAAEQTQQSSGGVTEESAEQQGLQADLGRAAPAVLDEHQQAYLDPASAEAAQFTPWPTALAMWSGSLARMHQGEPGPGDAEGSGEQSPPQEEHKEEAKPVNGELSGAGPKPERAPPVMTGEEVERRRAEAEARRIQQEEELGEFDLYDPDAE